MTNGSDANMQATSAAETAGSNDPKDDGVVRPSKLPIGRPYKKGQTGNPRGRPKGSKNLRTILERESLRLVEVSENGRRRYIPTWELTIKVMARQAAKGDYRAMSAFLKLLDKSGLLAPPESSPRANGIDDRRQSEMDRIILEYFGVTPDRDPQDCPDAPASKGPPPKTPVIH